MRRFAPDEWSRIDSPLHRCDARAKLTAALVVLVTLAASRHPGAAAGATPLLVAGLVFGRIPPRGFLLRLCLLAVFPCTFALFVALADPVHAATLAARSIASVAAFVLLVAVTPMPKLLGALAWFRMPPVLLEVVQFVYRYLFVLMEEALQMRTAAACRGGSRHAVAAASVIGVLFSRAYVRAEGIHRAMLARGFTGVVPFAAAQGLRGHDWLLLGIAAVWSGLTAGLLWRR